MDVAVRPTDAAGMEARLGRVKREIRKRAYELYCRRGGRKGSALGDWKRAEQERSEAPLAGITEDDNDIRITAYVPRKEPFTVALDVLPDEIVVEGERHGEVRRFTRLRLPARIDPTQVTARLEGNELDVIARKQSAQPAKPRSQAPAK
ncbi:MAG TPA: DUF2934 domain-containing protein [Bryobacteraceae bacterium]|nr:DUF2934 domain-containing protein [Bryobacteraceae bacterium]